ncbi:hypothetical protein [Bacillus weihaiensis]|uniref:Uncharacterized protein n=1 Tax=Bacillus weihaiensis TaxID=1547283 RepID=A0A1L3MU02_9BACI|nr:hypothetical protein [Bacillus weihaiensis]APH05817.1 hypothetical protein A9C19_14345 [Bacillus weihaiensis]
MSLRQLQFFLALPSAILSLLAYLVKNDFLFFLSLGGIFIAVCIRMIRIHKRGHILSHPDSRSFDAVDDVVSDIEEDK